MDNTLSRLSTWSTSQFKWVVALLLLSLGVLALAQPGAARSIVRQPSQPGACISGDITINTIYTGVICFEWALVKSGVTVTIQDNTFDYLVVGTSAANVTGAITLESGASLEIRNSVIGSLSLHDTYPASASVLINGNGIDFITVYAGAPALENNEIWASLNLRGRTGASITKNIFYGRTSYIDFRENEPGLSVGWDQTGPSPLITQNSFLSYYPFKYWLTKPPPTPISIGANYFGDKYCTSENVLYPHSVVFDSRCGSIGFVNEKIVGDETFKISRAGDPGKDRNVSG